VNANDVFCEIGREGGADAGVVEAAPVEVLFLASMLEDIGDDIFDVLFNDVGDMGTRGSRVGAEVPCMPVPDSGTVEFANGALVVQV
jgi:hypothetical protein